MMAIFSDFFEQSLDMVMDDFSNFDDSYNACLANLEKVLKCCEETNLVLN